MANTISIGSKVVGPANAPFIIAEMSGNHNGSLERALEIVQAAAESGADAIKLQTFTPSTLTIDSTRPEFYIDDAAGLWHGRRLFELYAEAYTPWEWHEPIFELARSHGMACISTAFDDSSLEFLRDLVDAIKIASFELVNVPLIAAASRLRKPLLLSTGMAELDEINDAVAAIGQENVERLILLKCTSAYPSDESDANLMTMQDMRQRYACQVGLSDHSLRPYVAYAAVALGASVIEKHFTLSRNDGGVDAAFSLEPQELRELVGGARVVWQSLGEICYSPRSAEYASRKERPSIYVVQPVSKSGTFTAANLRIIRPSSGLPPKFFESIIGRRARYDLAEGQPLSWEMIEDDRAI